jgi:signal peptidase II
MKYLAPSIDFEGGFVNFGLYKNYAGAFSLPIGGQVYNIAGITLLAVFLILFFRVASHKLQATGYLLIVLGGASNLFDRLFYGYTIDYVNVFNFSFFNLADGMLIAGIFFLLFGSAAKK